MKARLAPLFVLLASTLAGCDSEIVLSGNFDEWTSPTGMSGLLPGDPAGDTVSQYPLETAPGVDWYPGQVYGDSFYFIDAACPVGQGCMGNSPHRMVNFRSAYVDPAQQDNPFTWGLGGEAWVQPGADIRVSLYDGHFESVAVLHFERPTAADPATVSIEHGGGEQVLETLLPGEEWGYAVYADPQLGTFDVIGSASASDLPVITTPDASRRGIFMWFNNPTATASALGFEAIELYAEN